MPATIERISDEKWVPPWIRHQHITRYEWACQFTRSCTVIDVACGTGYGARILVERGGAREVIGYDLSSETIEAARISHGTEFIRFEVGDATNLPLADHSCDVYTSFETIEHVQDHRAFVREAARVLRPGGRFFCSTPNRRVTNPGIAPTGKPFNRFHIREYTAEELSALLAPRFRSVTLFGQTPFRKWYAGILNCIGRRIPIIAVRLHQLRKLLTMPMERAAWHTPSPLPAAWEPEVLLASCEA